MGATRDDEEAGPTGDVVRRVLDTWPVGKVGNPRAWCRYCGALIPGEHVADRYRTPHTEHCPVFPSPRVP